MRVAIISAVRPAQDNETVPVALLQFAGGSIARRQAQQAIDLGCEYVVLVCPHADPEVTEIQHLAEGNKSGFLLARSGQQLVERFSPDDALVVFADGTVWEDFQIREVIDENPVLTTLPADEAVKVGFERIDARDAWSGILVAPATIANGLTVLPPDSAVQSALLRLALQAGIARRRIALDDGRFPQDMFPLNTEDVRRIESRLVTADLQSSSWFTPANALIDRLAGRNATALLRGGFGGVVGFVAALALVVSAGIVGWFANAVAALIVIVIAAALSRMFCILSGVSAWQGQAPVKNRYFRGILRFGWSTGLIGLAALAVPAADWVVVAFATSVLVGLVAIADQRRRDRIIAPLTDQIVLTGIMAGAALFDAILPTAQAIALAVLVVLLFDSRRFSLTPN